MDEIVFSISLNPSAVLADRETYDISRLNRDGLFRIAYGKLTIDFGQYVGVIQIESEMIDYLDQINGALILLESGESSTCTVSGDYYSNNLLYEYDRQLGVLQIIDSNGGSFCISTSLVRFRHSFQEFLHDSVGQLEGYYPELSSNIEFRRVAQTWLCTSG